MGEMREILPKKRHISLLPAFLFLSIVLLAVLMIRIDIAVNHDMSTLKDTVTDLQAVIMQQNETISNQRELIDRLSTGLAETKDQLDSLDLANLDDVRHINSILTTDIDQWITHIDACGIELERSSETFGDYFTTINASCICTPATFVKETYIQDVYYGDEPLYWVTTKINGQQVDILVKDHE